MQSEQTTIHCKISFQNQLRRSSLSRLTYQDLEALIRSLFSLPLEQFAIKYKDEEDEMITISTDIELITAISYLKPNNLFRLTVTLKPQISTPQSIPITDKRKRKCMKQDFKRIKLEKSTEKHQQKEIKKAWKLQKRQEKEDFIRQYNSSFIPQSVIVPSLPSSIQPVTLTITNTGSSSWPEGTALVQVCKGKIIGERTQLPGSVPPSSSIPLTLNVQISDSGCHMSKWRVVLPNGAKFGAKFFVKSENFSPKQHCHKKEFHHRRFSHKNMAIRERRFQGPQRCQSMRQQGGDRVVADLVSQPQQA